MGQNNNSFFGWLCGLSGGLSKMYLLQIGPENPFTVKLMQAVLTAFLCGFAGAIGTHIYKSIFKNRK